MNNQKLQPKETPPQTGRILNDNARSQTASGRQLLAGLPRVWIALTGLATVVWLVGIGWGAVKLFQWLVD